MSLHSSMVGRQAEILTLEQALDDASCDGVALVGAPGVGKTMLGRRAADFALERSLTTVMIRATSSASRVPYAALSPFFRMLELPMASERDTFRTVISALETKCQGRVVMVVDDAHELDDASATLLGQLVDHSAVFVVLTARQGAQNSEAILDMWKDLRVLRIQVDPLPDDDIRNIAANTLGGSVDAAALHQMVRASAGNVLLLRELIQGAVESGALQQQYGLWRLEGSLAESARLRDLIERRLAGLTDEERTTLELVAIGEPLRLSVLEILVKVDTVERLEQRRLLEAAIEKADPEVRLAHPLYGEVVRATLPAVRRARLSRSLADTVESLRSLHGIDVLRVAVWRLDGGGGRPETIAAAARAAFRTEDYPLAERLGRAGWEEGRRVDAALVLGEVLDLLGRADEADAILAEAATVAITDHERTSLAIRHASLLFRSLGRAADADRIVAEARAVVKERSCLRELEVVQGDHLLLMGEVARAIELDRPLLHGPMDAAFAQAALDVGTALVLAGRTEEAIAQTSAALAVRLDLDEELHLSRTGVYVVAHSMALAGAGRLSEASLMAEAAYKVAVERRMVDGQAWLAAVLGQIRMTQGRMRASETFFRETASLFGHLKHPGKRWGLGGLAMAAAQLGNHAVAAEAVAELESIELPSVRLMDISIVRGRAWNAVVSNDLASARRLLWEAVELAERWGQLAGAVEALFDLIRIGERGSAIIRLIEFEGQVDGDLMVARLVHTRALSLGDPALASQAVDRFEALGALLFAAESSTLEHHLARNQGLHRQASAAAARAEELAARCEGARTPALTTSLEADALSQREREVAMLAVSGLTSREIAERLFVSKRTVDNHLQRIYTKLGIAGRHELGGRLGEVDVSAPASPAPSGPLTDPVIQAP